jgi:ABC-2 type transport system ATP-binding protein
VLLAAPEAGVADKSRAAVETIKLTRRFGRLTAVNELDLRVPAGSVYGLLGPNGAGKTTALKILTGLLHPTAGEARVAGELVGPGRSSLALRRRIGFLAEEPAFYGWMRAAEFLVFTGDIFGLRKPDARRRADELLEVVGLSGRGGDRIRGFSRGMRQRLGIAQALVGRPQVLFLDEPASALDPLGRKEVLDLTATLAGDTTIVMSSHILDDVQRVCDWVGIMDQGLLLVEAPLEELLASYGRPALELEVTRPDGSLATALASAPWLDALEERPGGWRLHVKDLPAAQREIPAILSAQGAELVAFGLTTPSLEDVFVRLVGTRGRS